jgi:toxin YoeB
VRLLRKKRMNKLFTENGWEDYVFWQTEDRKTLRKINLLLKDIERNGNEGIGKPEPLRGNLSGFWSRRINDKDRLIYKVDQNNIYILACRYHYNEK